MIRRPGGAMAGAAQVRVSELLPVVRMPHNLVSKAFLLPFIFFFAACEILFGAASNGNLLVYFWTLAIMIAVGTLYFVFRLCGKSGSFLFLIVVAILTGILIWLCGGAVKYLEAHIDQATLPISVSPGLVEESFKAIPLVIMLLVSPFLSPAWREKIGLSEPLDGILFAAASALGFGVVETWAVYEPAFGYLFVIPRTLDLIAGHVAFTGVLGYFIGLALIRRSRVLGRAGIVILGFIIAAGLHDLWDNLPGNIEIQFAVPVLCYAFLMSGILKARLISPNRYRLRPSIVLDPIPAAPRAGAAAWPPPRGGGAPSLWLAVGAEAIALHAGTRLREGSIPNLQSGAGDRIVAEISPNPSDPAIQGLKNLSQTTWNSLSCDGIRHQIPPGRTIRLDKGTRLDFGSSEGLILASSTP